MKAGILLSLLWLLASSALAAPIIPTSNSNNVLYYQIGGAQDYTLLPVQDTSTINLNVGADLGLGNQCSMFNTALSIQNTLNNLQDSVNSLEQTLIISATGSIAEIAMYFLA